MVSVLSYSEEHWGLGFELQQHGQMDPVSTRHYGQQQHERHHDDEKNWLPWRWNLREEGSQAASDTSQSYLPGVDNTVRECGG